VSVVIAAGIVLAGEDLEVLAPGWLLVEDGRIADIGAGRPPDQAGPVVDASDLLVVPAFVNAHTHVSDAVMKDQGFGQPFWELVMPPDGLRHRVIRATPPDVLRAAIEDTLDYMVAAGTSTFVDFREGGLDGVRLLKQAAAGRSIRAVALGRFRRSPPQPPEALERNVGRLGPADLAEVDEILVAGDGFSFPSANDATDEALEQVAHLVRSRGRLLAVHAAEASRYRGISLARTRRGDVERILDYLRPDFVVHLTDATAAELDLLAAAGARAVVCPRIQGVMGLGVPRFDWMLERGMLVALGTDNVMLSAPDMLRELDYASRAIRATRRDPRYPPAREMLRMATVNGARIIGRGDELGSLARGKRADMVMFDLDSLNLRPLHDPVASLVNRADIADIRAVVHEGRVARGALPALAAV
jgi:cytosine/adenosine deaminase-related metal-dependent hydrolase